MDHLRSDQNNPLLYVSIEGRSGGGQFGSMVEISQKEGVGGGMKELLRDLYDYSCGPAKD
jgi:hypothetical protein